MLVIQYKDPHSNMKNYLVSQKQVFRFFNIAHEKLYNLIDSLIDTTKTKKAQSTKFQDQWTSIISGRIMYSIV